MILQYESNASDVVGYLRTRTDNCTVSRSVRVSICADHDFACFTRCDAQNEYPVTTESTAYIDGRCDEAD